MNATDVLDLYWDGVLPVDLLKIAEKVGIKVYEECMDNKDFIGYINNKIAPEIHLNYKLDDTRKRFLVAHLMGHLFLGHNIDTEQDDNSYGKGEL